jgi:rod shape-determining protein MreC
MTNKSRVFLLLLIFLILLHFIYTSRRQEKQSPFILNQIIVNVYQPVVELYHSVSNFLSDKSEKYVFVIGKHDENKVLRLENALLKIRNERLVTQFKSMQAFDEVVKVYQGLAKGIVQADIIAFDPFSQSKTIMISKGADKGLLVNMPVVTVEGLVGRVIEVYKESSKVLLLVDHYFSVDAIVRNSNLRSLVTGIRTGNLKAQRVPYLAQSEFVQHSLALTIGDVLVTSGMSDIYPKGIPVGKVVRNYFSDTGFIEKSLVLPAIDFTKMNQVFILLK